jgi:uncharacterized membrane protein
MAVEHNVLVMQFTDPSKTFQAFSKIKDQPGVTGAAVVERTAEGQVRVADGFEPQAGAGIAVGGLVGGLIGVLGGPLGLLLGWSTGMVVGSMYESDEEADTDDGFTILSRSIANGGNALIVEISETSHAIADDIATQLDGTVTRVPASDVEHEIAAAREATRSAAAEARKVRRSKRRAEFKEKLQAHKPHAHA